MGLKLIPSEALDDEQTAFRLDGCEIWWEPDNVDPVSPDPDYAEGGARKVGYFDRDRLYWLDGSQDEVVIAVDFLMAGFDQVYPRVRTEV